MENGLCARATADHPLHQRTTIMNAPYSPQPPVWHALATEQVLQVLDSTPGSLSEAEAARWLEVHGPNRLRPPQQRGPVMRFLLQFHNYVLGELRHKATRMGTVRRLTEEVGRGLRVALPNLRKTVSNTLLRRRLKRQQPLPPFYHVCSNDEEH